MPDIFSVGVDLGGTWVRLEAVDARGHHIKSFKAPSVPVAQLPAVLKKRLRAWKARPAYLIVASRGIWMPKERTHLKSKLRSLAGHITVMSDVEAAWHAAFGHKGPGVVVIAGTGSIAYGRDVKGRSKRAGGWGPLLGDEGSAFWMGKTWLNRTRNGSEKNILKLVHAPHDAVRRIAGLAPTILKNAQRGNLLAKGVVLEAQNHLANLVLHTVRPLKLKSPVPVSWGGGLMDNPTFRAGVLKTLSRNRFRSRFKAVPPSPNAALAIARLIA